MLQYETEPANSQGMNGAALGLGITSLALGILGVLFNFIFCCGWIAALPCTAWGLFSVLPDWWLPSSANGVVSGCRLRESLPVLWDLCLLACGWPYLVI